MYYEVLTYKQWVSQDCQFLSLTSEDELNRDINCTLKKLSWNQEGGTNHDLAHIFIS